MGPRHHRWSAAGHAVLRDCFGGLITLTEVSRRQAADIVVHYMPTAGGVEFGGYALAFVFAWALEGAEPAPPGEGPSDCSLD
jgi:hypothetical protein